MRRTWSSCSDCQKGKSVTNIGSVEEEQETYVGGSGASRMSRPSWWTRVGRS